jgi:hypothetical protein
MSRYETELARIADRLIDRYGKDASLEAGKRADDRRKIGKRHLEIKWLTVLMIVEERRRQERQARRQWHHHFSRLRFRRS